MAAPALALRRLSFQAALWPLLAALLSFAAWQPFVRPDFDVWQADDGEYHLLRVYVFGAAAKAGEWLPRWTPDLFVGFGYPIFNFYAPATYYVAMALRALGLDVFTTVQALGALACCTAAAGAYCFARSVFGSRLAGLVAAVAYVYAPYPFITNLIVRADLAETLGLAILPWALRAAWHAGRDARRRDVAVLALAMGALVLTHNLTALVALPAAAAVVLFATWRAAATRGAMQPTSQRSALGVRSWFLVPGSASFSPQPSVHSAFAAGAAAGLGGLAMALLLTTFFWLPALVEQKDVQIEVALSSGHKSPRSWLIDPLGATEQTRRAGNPQTVNGPLDLHLSYPYNLNFPPKPSLAQGALAVVAGVVVFTGLAARRPGGAEAAFFLAGTAILWVATTTWSGWAWDHVPLMRFLQFAWRLYGPLSLSLGMAAAGAAALARRRHWLLAALVAAPALLLAPNTTTARPLWIDDHVERRAGGPQLVGTENALFGAGTTTGGEFVPRTVDLGTVGSGERRGNGVYERLFPEFGWLAGRVWLFDANARIMKVSAGPTWTDVRVEAQAPATIGFRTVAFPGWRAYLDGKPALAKLAPRDETLGVSPGFLTVDVPAGTHTVQIAFGPTRTRTAAAVVSVAALASLGWFLARSPQSAVRSPQSKVRHLAPAVSLPPAAVRRPPSRLMVLLAPAALAAVAVAHDALRPALGAPIRPAATQQRLLADVIALTESGKAQIASPSGAGLGPFVNIQRLYLPNRERRWLYMHPPSSVSLALELPPRAAFQAGLGLDPRTWDAEGADGVRYILEVTPDGGATSRVLDERVNPRALTEQRAWLDRWADLSAFGGQRVTLTLRTDPANTVDYDWAGWADPTVFVQLDARRPGGGPPEPLSTPRAN